MQRLNRTVLYGWGQTQALPLLKGSMDRVLNKPQLLKQLDDYALPVIQKRKKKEKRANCFLLERRNCDAFGHWLGPFSPWYRHE